MWNRLHIIARNAGKRFSVHFMNAVEPNRKWVIEGCNEFDSVCWNLKLHYFRGIPIRFSAKYVFSVIQGGGHLILGSSWNDLNVITIILLKRFGIIDNKISFWSEANRYTVGATKYSKMKFAIRRYILNSADGNYFVPGRMAEITLLEWGVSCSGRLVKLPNLPHESFDSNLGTWVGGRNSAPVLTVVARMDESTKGILNFLKALGKERIRSVSLRLIGSGPDEVKYADWIASEGVDDCVQLMGELPSKQIIKFLQESDGFVLPSLSDSSPLSLVEAIKIGVPILVSRRCGNHYECLAEGVNGFGFDPDSHGDIRKAFDLFIEAKKSWRAFGHGSLELAKINFDSDAVLRNLADHLD